MIFLRDRRVPNTNRPAHLQSIMASPKCTPLLHRGGKFSKRPWPSLRMCYPRPTTRLLPPHPAENPKTLPVKRGLPPSPSPFFTEEGDKKSPIAILLIKYKKPEPIFSFSSSLPLSFSRFFFLLKETSGRI